MITDFSEFSFGYAAIREAEGRLTDIYRTCGAPVLPSLIQEESIGWDAKLPTLEYALFLQFKRPEYVSRRHPSSPTWDDVGHPRYRFTIDTAGHQHQRLLELEHEIVSGAQAGDVYYVAPHFHEQTDFDRAYLNGLVLDGSVIEPPSEFGHDGQKHHHVTDAVTGAAQVLSEPRAPTKEILWMGLQERITGRAERRNNPGSDRLDLAGLEQILALAARGLEAARTRNLDAPIARRIDRLATSLGCGLVLITTETAQ